jgi:hypothetical protein
VNDPIPFSDAVRDIDIPHEPGLNLRGADLARSELDTGMARNRARRVRVLTHPDLCKRLVDELGYARADDWTGYVPPRFGPEQVPQRGGFIPDRRKNPDRNRAVLIDICAEALRRDQEGTTT